MDQLQAWLQNAIDIALGWLASPAALSQFALLILAYILARLLARRLAPLVERTLTPKPESVHIFAGVSRFGLQFLPLLLPLLAYALTAIGESLTRATFGSGEVIAFGKRVFLLLAALELVRKVLPPGFLKLMGRYILLPVMALNALGVLDEVTAWLDAAQVNLGDIRFTALGLIRGAIAGVLLFWLGAWSNRQSACYIKAQPDLRPATRELAIKASEIAIFGAAFLLLMSIMGIDLTSIAVIGGVVGVGIGLGQQQIAANFLSGVILLLQGQTTVGDYVELDNGEAGTILKMTARTCILETIDGRWIVVPNEDFITSRVINYSDAGAAHRHEVEFSVSYDTDINRVPALIEAAVAALPFVLQKPEAPECELRGFGDSGVEFGVEYWVNGIEDLTHKFQSDILFAVWNALKAKGIKIPYPRRVVELRNATLA